MFKRTKKNEKLNWTPSKYLYVNTSGSNRYFTYEFHDIMLFDSTVLHKGYMFNHEDNTPDFILIESPLTF